MDIGLEVVGKAITWVILGLTVGWLLTGVLNRWFPLTKRKKDKVDHDDDIESD